MSEKHIHHGRNIKRLREMLGIKQQTLAAEMGGDWNQKKISLLEGKDEIDEKIIEDVAKALNLPKEAIENFDEEANVLNIQNNYEGSVLNNSSVYQANCTFNPIDKIIELYDEKIALYERMLKEKDEIMQRLEGLIKGK